MPSSFITSPPPEFVVIQRQEASASASIEIDSSVITADYSEYIIELEDIVPSTNGAFLDMVVSEDNGTTYHRTTTYRLASLYTASSSSTVSGYAQADTASILLSHQPTGNGTGVSLSGQIKVKNPSTSGFYKKFFMNTSNINTVSKYELYSGSCLFKLNTNALNNFLIAFQAGTITSGKVIVWGKK